MKAYYADLIITEQGPIHEAYLLEKNGKIIGIEGKSVAEKRTFFLIMFR